MDWMKPSRVNQLPQKDGSWYYEMKYDGFRARLDWNGETVQLISKNGHDLIDKFPEIEDTVYEYFPEDTTISLDGELAILENYGKAEFYSLQRRQRLQSSQTIKREVRARPAVFLAFDCLDFDNSDLRQKILETRKEILQTFLEQTKLPLLPAPHSSSHVQLLPFYQDIDELMEINLICRGEGIVAKRKSSLYEKGRTTHWVKYKTPFQSPCFITSYDPANNYFQLGVRNGNQTQLIGKCSHGFAPDELAALIQILKQNGTWNTKEKLFTIDPSVVVEITYTTRKNNELREPRFSHFRFNLPADQCTSELLKIADLRFPKDVEITNPDKPLWPNNSVQKLDFLHYVRQAAPYILSYLMNRELTVIRYPHGMFEKGFFQKECPEYAPPYVKSTKAKGTNFILCNNIRTLLWLANQLAIEWHIPFQMYQSEFVQEIVFDLDPPNTNYFHLAIEGALLLKELCDLFSIVSFVKFSGNKGLQVYIPLPEEKYKWKDTNIITETFGAFLTKKHPELFTQERLKKNRGNKLYIDIPQHREGKTIIAPYSLRGKEMPLVAAPLFWKEVNGNLNREAFTMEYTLQRLRSIGCPFQQMERIRETQPIDELLSALTSR